MPTPDQSLIRANNSTIIRNCTFDNFVPLTIDRYPFYNCSDHSGNILSFTDNTVIRDLKEGAAWVNTDGNGGILTADCTNGLIASVTKIPGAVGKYNIKFSRRVYMPVVSLLKTSSPNSPAFVQQDAYNWPDDSSVKFPNNLNVTVLDRSGVAFDPASTDFCFNVSISKNILRY